MSKFEKRLRFQRVKLRELLKSGILDYYQVPYSYRKDGFRACRFATPEPFDYVRLVQKFRNRVQRTKNKERRQSLKRHLQRLEDELDAHAEAPVVPTLFITQDCDVNQVNHEIAHYIIATRRQRLDPDFALNAGDVGKNYSNLMETRTLLLNAVFDEYFGVTPAYYLIYEDFVKYTEDLNDPALKHRPDLVLSEFIDNKEEIRRIYIPYYKNTAAKERIERAYFWLLKNGYFDGPFAVKHPIVARKLRLFT